MDGHWQEDPTQYDAAECETLYLSPSWLPGGLSSQKVAVAATENNAKGDHPTVSLQVVSFDLQSRPTVGSVWLTLDETDRLIGALEEAKTRLLRMRGA